MQQSRAYNPDKFVSMRPSARKMIIMIVIRILLQLIRMLVL